MNKSIKTANNGRRGQPSQKSKLDQSGDGSDSDVGRDSSFIGLNYRKIRATSELSDDLEDHYNSIRMPSERDQTTYVAMGIGKK